MLIARRPPASHLLPNPSLLRTDHYLFFTLKTPGIPLETPPSRKVEWEEGILFQRWIKTFRIPLQKPGIHSAAILFDGIPLGEATFLVRFAGETAKPSPEY